MAISEERKHEIVHKLVELMKYIDKMNQEELRYHERMEKLIPKAQGLFEEISELIYSED